LDINGQPSAAQVWAAFKAKYIGCLIGFALFTIVVQIGFKLYYLPGIYLTPVFCLFMAIKGLEKLSLVDAAKKSFVIIQNNWWLTLCVIFITVIALAIPLAIIRKIMTSTLTKPGIALINIPFTYICDYLFMAFFVATGFCYLALIGRNTTTAVLAVETGDELDPL